MTKSIQKAQVNDIAIKGEKGDDEIYFIAPHKIVVNNKTVDEIIKGLEEDINNLNLEVEKQAKINTSLQNSIKGLNKENEALKGQLNDFKRLFEDTIERWVEL